MQLNTVATIGKSLSVKREKQPDETEALVAHLKFTDALLDRDTINRIVGANVGFLFDELGAPVARLVLGLPRLALTATGAIHGSTERADLRLTLADAELSGIEIALADKAGNLSAELTWKAAGDEVSDIEGLLGQLCVVDFALEDGGQADLFRDNESGRKARAR